MSSFDKPFPVIARSVGMYVDGVWTVPTEAAPVMVMGNCQPVTATEYDKMKLEDYGRRIEHARKFYTTAKLNIAGENNSPGDILIYRDKRYIVMGEAIYDALSDLTNHNRYWLFEEIAKELGERPS